MTTEDAQALALSERDLCGLVNGLARQIGDHVRERAATLGLTTPQANALRELAAPMTARALAERMSCEPSNATFVIDNLERKGLIQRRPHPTDRRAKQLVLTSEGAELRERLLALLIEKSPFATLTQQEQADLERLLSRAIIHP